MCVTCVMCDELVVGCELLLLRMLRVVRPKFIYSVLFDVWSYGTFSTGCENSEVRGKNSRISKFEDGEFSAVTVSFLYALDVL